MPREIALLVEDLAKLHHLEVEFSLADCLPALEEAFRSPQELLLSHGTSVIVPAHILETPNLLALNIHSASPEFPGRDPHHFAVYLHAKEYGATIHYMIDSVDAGPIVDVDLFPVPSNSTPFDLLQKANASSIRLITGLMQTLAKGEIPKVRSDIAWGKNRTTRKMFLDLCRIDAAIDEAEFQRRLMATAMPGYQNLVVEKFGHRFRICD